MTRPSRPAAGDSDPGPPVQYVRGVGPSRARLLERLGVRTPADLLRFAPRHHEDRRVLTPLSELRDGDRATVRGLVREVRFRRIFGRRSLVEVVVADGDGVVVAEWWNQPYRKEHFREGDPVVLSGRVHAKGGMRMSAPEVEVLRGEGETPAGEADGGDDGPTPGDAPSLHWGRLVPVYPLTRGLTQGPLRRAVRAVLDRHRGAAVDPVPAAVAAAHDLPPLEDALEALHFPATPEAGEAARRRLRFEELLLLQTAMALRRRDLEREVRAFRYAVDARLDGRIRARFPFPFTGGQDRAVADITADLASPHPMNRLLQGDVGCGKTAVALYALLVAVAHGRQGAILAPTEILAEQHHGTFRRALKGSRVRIHFLGGGVGGKRRAALLEEVAGDGADLVIGTHAVLEQDVRFRDLGVAVIDEQHRFGVLQRRTFRDKGLQPDLLYLTATPIPRTLCMTVFGDLDVSVIAERPPGRHPVATRRFRRREERAVHALLRAEIAAGRQAFVVCPLVEESEELDLRAATAEAERLRTEVFPDLRVGLLHGRMSRDDKRAAMEEFRAGRTQVLVTTVVVEVGVDVPNASVLCILHAERFGLATLHQLRGRVGRGPHGSLCLLVSDARSGDADARLDAMVETEDGFRIAEEDLRLRGPGEFFGTRQHGLPDLRTPEALADAPLVDAARRAALAIVERDPDLRAAPHAPLRTTLLERFGEGLALARV